MNDPGTVTTQYQLTEIVLKEHKISHIHYQDLWDVCKQLTEPARPSSCIDWTEKFAVPLIQLMAERIYYLSIHLNSPSGCME